MIYLLNVEINRDIEDVRQKIESKENDENATRKETIEIEAEPGANKRNVVRVSSLADLVSDVDNNDNMDLNQIGHILNNSDI